MGEAVGIAMVVVSAAGMAFGAYSDYRTGIEIKKSNEAQAEALREQARLQYEESLRRAKVENTKAGIAQIQGEREAEDRSRRLAAAIGSTYANWAGNGLLVDATEDSLTSVLTQQVQEANADISTIKDNAAIETWNFLEQERSIKQQANIDLLAVRNQADALDTAGKIAYESGVMKGIAGGIKAVGALGSGLATVNSVYGNSEIGLTGIGKFVDSTNTLRGSKNYLGMSFGGKAKA